MQYHKQLITHDPENGKYGDCYRTAIACLLNMQPAEVPHFCEDGVKEGDESNIKQKVREWLSTQGYWFIEIPFKMDLEDVLNWQKCMNPNVYHILLGQSSLGVNHNVICCNGKIVHDPSGSNTGIVGPVHAKEEYDRVYWLEFIIPLSQVRASEQ